MCNQALEQQEAELAAQLAGEREAQQAFTLEEVLVGMKVLASAFSCGV